MSYKTPQASDTVVGNTRYATAAEAATGTATTVAMTPSTAASNAAYAEQTGFISWGGAGNYYSVAGTDFTLLRPGSGMIKGKKVDWLGSQSTGSLAAGTLNWVYIDSTGTIGSTSTFASTTFTDNICLFEVLVDNTPVTPNVIVVKENHPYSIPARVSLELHDVIGTVIEGGGAEITLHGTKAIQIVGADELHDHGLSTTIPDSAAAAVTFSFMHTDAGGKWVRNSTGTTFPSAYNAAGTWTALTAGRYGVFRLYVSKDDLNSSTPTYYAVAHTAQFTNLTTANNAIATGVAEATNELLNLELCQLGYVIKKESDDTITQVIIEKDTLRSNVIGASNANTANLITTDTTNFGGILSATDTTVQAALDTIDDYTPPSAGMVITTYDASGTHTKNASTKKVEVYITQGGGGGGSGRRGAAGSERYGGGGGGSGLNSAYLIWGSGFPDSTTITVGDGGIGGTAQTADDSDGVDGGVGGESYVDTTLYAGGTSAQYGKKGTATSGNGGSASSAVPYFTGSFASVAGGAGGNTTGSSGADTSATTGFTSTSGGGGGGMPAANTVHDGGRGGRKTGASTLGGTVKYLLGSGAGGVSGGDGGDGLSVPSAYAFSGGTGGGGGASSKTTNAGAGGDGGVPGGGGGGGGASLNATGNSGAGGKGGKGRVVIVEYL